MKKLLFLTAILWLNGLSSAQNYPCDFDSLWQKDAQKDSSLFWKHQAHINRVNHFRSLPQWNYQVIDSGSGTSGLQGGCSHALFVIPVVVHVVHDPNNPQSNLHDSLVEDQIRILNEGFTFSPKKKLRQHLIIKMNPYI